MQIEIAIRHEFGDVGAFAAFAAKLQSLFAEYSPKVVVPAPRFEDVKCPPTDPALLAKINAAVEPHVAVVAPSPSFDVVPNSDTVAAPVSPDCAASAIAPAPVSEASISVGLEDHKPRAPDKDKMRKPRGPYKKKETPEPIAPASLPVAGSFGGPAVVATPPATAPSAPAVGPSPAAGATNLKPSVVDAVAKSDLEADKTYALEWIGRNSHAEYMKRIAAYQDHSAGKVRLQDFTAEERAKFVAELRANDRKI